MRRLLLTLEYDGTELAGFQLQPDARTVQGVLEAAILSVTGRASRVVGAGRTDAGVHASGMTAHVDTASDLDDASLRRALNAELPEDVAVCGVASVSAELHARFSARSRRYRYRILNRREPAPLRRHVTWHLRAPLDREAMLEAARALAGSHDFAAFRGARGGAPPDEETVRSLDHVALEAAGDELQLVLEGRSFLRNMVRVVAGTLAEVGRGRRSVEGVRALLVGGERAEAGPTAPAHGLCLEAVRYPAELLDPPG